MLAAGTGLAKMASIRIRIFVPQLHGCHFRRNTVNSDTSERETIHAGRLSRCGPTGKRQNRSKFGAQADFVENSKLNLVECGPEGSSKGETRLV